MRHYKKYDNMGKKRSDYYIKFIKRVTQVLNSFTLKEKELRVTELSKKLNLHKSTIHCILITLEDEGFIVKISFLKNII